MTVIAAIATPTHVVMGSDIMADYGGAVILKASSKVFALKASDGERVLIGAAGNIGLGPLVRQGVVIESTPDPSDVDATDEWASTIATAISGVCADATPPMTVTTDGAASGLDGMLLMAWRQHLWYVTTHAAFRAESGVAAVGSGDEAARGAMHAALDYGASAEDAVNSGIRWASEINSGCRIDARGPRVLTTEEQP